MDRIRRESRYVAEWRYWVERAEKARTMAEAGSDPIARDTMLRFAEKYDGVAEVLKARAAIAAN